MSVYKETRAIEVSITRESTVGELVDLLDELDNGISPSITLFADLSGHIRIYDIDDIHIDVALDEGKCLVNL